MNFWWRSPWIVHRSGAKHLWKKHPLMAGNSAIWGPHWPWVHQTASAKAWTFWLAQWFDGPNPAPVGIVRTLYRFSYLMISTGAGCCLFTVASFLWWSARESTCCQEEMEYASKGSHLIPSHAFFFIQLGPCNQMAFGFPKIQIARRDYFTQKISVGVPGQPVVVFEHATLAYEETRRVPICTLVTLVVYATRSQPVSDMNKRSQPEWLKMIGISSGRCWLHIEDVLEEQNK